MSHGNAWLSSVSHCNNFLCKGTYSLTRNKVSIKIIHKIYVRFHRQVTPGFTLGRTWFVLGYLGQYCPANMGTAVPYLTVAYFKSVYKIFPAIATGTSSWNYSIFHAWSILPYKLIYFPSDKRLQKISWWHLSLKHGISNDSLFHGIVDTAIKNRCALCNSC